jgi:hypothetical protein
MIKLTTAHWAGAAGLVIVGLAAALTVLPAAAATTAGPSPVVSMGVSFSCALSDFGSTTPITINGTMAVPLRGTAGQALTVTLATQPVSLPSAVSSQLPALSTITMAAQSPVSKGPFAPPAKKPGGFVHWTGQTGPVSAGAATIPASTAKATLIPIQPGTATVSTPSSITLTPVGASASYAPIECDGPASSFTFQITIKNPPLPAPPPPPKHLPLYRCLLGGQARHPLTVGFPIRITATGPATVSTREQVTMTLFPPRYVAARTAVSGGSGKPSQLVLGLTAALPVTGAQTGAVQVSGRNGANAARLHAAGTLALTAAGQDTILLPSHFRLTAQAGHRAVPMFSCTLKGRADRAAATLTVAAGPADASGTPSGAPATGGGTGPGAGINRVLALGGIGALLGGAGITLAALARRRRQPRVTA